jgi:hypothetical protein
MVPQFLAADKLQGTWRLVGVERDGERFDQDDLSPTYFWFDRGEWHFPFVSGRCRRTVGRRDDRGKETQASDEFEYRLSESGRGGDNFTMLYLNKQGEYHKYWYGINRDDFYLMELPGVGVESLPRSEDDATAEKGSGRTLLFLSRRPGLP